jgi:hypothetical protein
MKKPLSSASIRMLSEFEDHVTISSSTNDARNGGRWARSGTAGEAKAWAHRAGLTHAARIHSLRASRRGPGAGAAAGARCRPVCPRARARNEPAQNGGLVGGARGTEQWSLASLVAGLRVIIMEQKTPKQLDVRTHSCIAFGLETFFKP